MKTGVKPAIGCMLILGGAANLRADDLIVPGADLVEVYSVSRYFEGPSWDVAGGKLYFTQLTGEQRILRLTPPSSVSVWMDNTAGINGTYLSLDGRLLAAQGDAKAVVSYRIGVSGPEDAQVLAQNSGWKPPNDLCQSPAGDIYFTCPDFNSQSAGRVYRIAPTSAVTTAITDMPVPNGIITSIDGRTLYISDSHLRLWRSYPVNLDGTVGAGSVFFNPSTGDMTEPDGMTIDELGNLYFCGRGGVWIVSPGGVELDMIPVPVFCSNVTFGGADGRTLYITGDTRLYSLAMQVRGAAWRLIEDPNEPPQVDAGPDRVVCLPHSTAAMNAIVTDDGLPDPPAFVTLDWVQIGGPPGAVFDQPTSTTTDVTFPQIGTYTLRLIAFDGMRNSADDVTVTVAKPGDYDADDDVDTDDTSRLVPCLTGPALGPPAGGCESMDLDLDDDVDSGDFGLFQRCLSGPFEASDPACADF